MQKQSTKMGESTAMQRHTNKKSKQSDDLWQLTFDAVKEAVCLLDTNGKITRSNRAFSELLGMPMEAIIGETCWEIVRGTATPFDECPMVKMKQTLRRETLELPVKGRRYLITADPIFDKERTLTGAVNIFHEITAVRKAEAALRENEGMLRSIFCASPVGIGLVSSPGRILLKVNERLCQMLGYEKEELVGKSARILYETDDEFEHVGRKKYECIRERGIGTVETRWRCKDGSMLNILLSSSPIDKDNISLGVTFTALDITGGKRAKEAQKKADDALKENERELRKRLRELEDFYRMAVGRELKMKELKGRISRLEEELSRLQNKSF